MLLFKKMFYFMKLAMGYMSIPGFSIVFMSYTTLIVYRDVLPRENSCHSLLFTKN